MLLRLTLNFVLCLEASTGFNSLGGIYLLGFIIGLTSSNNDRFLERGEMKAGLFGAT